MRGMKALDLFCGGGGATLGLQRLGFDVTGVDIEERNAKAYPGTFIHGDALDPPCSIWDFDLIWASPPCQRFSTATFVNRKGNHPDLVGPTREMVAQHPYTIMENVPGSPMRADIVLYGPMVGLERISRRRHFETSFWPGLLPPPRRPDPSVFRSGRGVTVTTSMSSIGHYYHRKKIGLSGRVPNWEAREVMGIDIPMTNKQVGEAVPPAYAEFVGRRALLSMAGAI